MAHTPILSNVVEGLKLTPSCCSWTSHPNGCSSSSGGRAEPSAAARPSDSSTGPALPGGPKNTFASPSKSQLLLFQKDKCSSSSNEASNCHCCCCCSRSSDIDIIRTVWILPESASVLVIMHNTTAADPESTRNSEVDLSSLVSSRCIDSMAENERTSSDFIPLNSDHHTLLLRNSNQSSCGVQHRNRTKRKRESSSVSRHATNGDPPVERVMLNGDSKSVGEKSLKSSEQNGPVWKPQTREYSKSGIIR